MNQSVWEAEQARGESTLQNEEITNRLETVDKDARFDSKPSLIVRF
jgi:hypothetical protein